MILKDIFSSIIDSLYQEFGNSALDLNIYPDWYDGDTVGNIVVEGTPYMIYEDMTDDDFNATVETIKKDLLSDDDKETIEEVSEDLGNEITEQSDTVENAGNTAIANDYPALLVALDSERDAEVTYKTLIEIEESSENPRQDVIDLLKKILSDEMEHIALLSALQAGKASSFVGEDSKEEFDNLVESINN